jgi:O-antigen/teichoic acid export membrane protein
VKSAGSLRRNVGWVFAGNSVYAAGQWAILSLFAKIGGSEMLGAYALAVAIVTPVLMLSHLNLRAVLATDMGGERPIGDYLAVRYGSMLLGLLTIVVLAARYSRPLALTIIGVGLAQSAENLSDVYYGAMQRRERMRQISVSMMGRAVVSAIAVGLALWWTHNLVIAVTALIAGRCVILVCYDRPVGAAGEELKMTGLRSQLTIARTALPLGLVLMLSSLNSNLPRYAIERFLSLSQLGGFAAASSFVTIGGTVVNALGQAATPRLAKHFGEGDSRAFSRLSAELAVLAVAIGVAGLLGVAVFGKLLLRLIYRPEFERYEGILIATMAAGVAAYAASMLGYVLTSARVFDAQLPLFGLVAAACGAAAWILVPRVGLAGAPIALAIAAGIQVAGELAILRRAIGGPKKAG